MANIGRCFINLLLAIFDAIYSGLCTLWTKIWNGVDRNPVTLVSMILGTAVIVWLVASTIDIDMHNLPGTENYMHYQKWNAWCLFVEWYEATH